MFSSLFGEKEKWKVEVIRPFNDIHVGMAHDEHVRKIYVGATGTATVTKKGGVTVTFDSIQDSPYTRPLSIYFKKGEPRDGDFKWIEQVKKDNPESKVKKSSIFS